MTNETVEQVVGEFKTPSHTCKNCDFEVCPSIIVFADRIMAAHNREIDAIAAQKTAEAHEAFVRNAELADAIAAKDSMIAEQSAVNESQAAQLRDALNKCEELKCAIADSKRISDAVVKSLRDKNLEMSGEIAAKDAEIVRLRSLVGELADALLAACDDTCDYCKNHLGFS